jgi:hypothetical protein
MCTFGIDVQGKDDVIRLLFRGSGSGFGFLRFRGSM